MNDKRERFIRIAEKRTQKVLDDLRSLSKCTHPSWYEFNEADVEKIFSAIEEELQRTKAIFAGKKRFSLSSHDEGEDGSSEETSRPCLNQPKTCSVCGAKLVWEHPDIPGVMLESSEYEPGFDLCHTCLVEHCVNTNCLKCEIGKYPECRFLGTKQFYSEEAAKEIHHAIVKNLCDLKETIEREE